MLDISAVCVATVHVTAAVNVEVERHGSRKSLIPKLHRSIKVVNIVNDCRRRRRGKGNPVGVWAVVSSSLLGCVLAGWILDGRVLDGRDLNLRVLDGRVLFGRKGHDICAHVGLVCGHVLVK